MTSHRTTFGIRPWLALVGLLAAVLGVAGCGLGGSDEVPAPTLGTIGSTTTTTTTTTIDAGTGGADDGPEAGDASDDMVSTTTSGMPTTTTIVGWTGAVHPLPA